MPDRRDALLERLRAVRNEDAASLVALVASAYDEHSGCVLDLPGVDADLTAPATTAAERGGPWWVIEDDGEVVATVGAGPLLPDGTLELKRLYVASSHRRVGLGEALVGHVESHARSLGASGVMLWSDTRFGDAHRLYERLGYGDTGQTRHLDDPSNTTERQFRRQL